MTTAPDSHSSRCAILLIACPDRQGIVAAVTRFLFDHHGNILHLDQHVDVEENVFFMRVQWELDGFALKDDEMAERFRAVGEPFEMQFSLHFTEHRPRAALFVSKLSHCLYDALSRHDAGEWRADFCMVISNHPDLEPVARRFDIPFHVIPVTAENRQEQEAKQLELLEREGIDFIILARYMQVLSGDFLSRYPNRVINIHHSFLPAFPGARPYHSAYARGVKIIGATSHYATEDLDAGPIIAQDVIRVSHKDSVRDLVRKGRDLEKVVMARAVWWHLQNKILVYNNKTVIFD